MDWGSTFRDPPPRSSYGSSHDFSGAGGVGGAPPLSLSARLLAVAEEQAAKDASDARRSQVRTVDRSERIRTYNFPQGRVTDHRINLTLYKLGEALEGDLDLIIQPLLNEHQADLMAQMAES